MRPCNGLCGSETKGVNGVSYCSFVFVWRMQAFVDGGFQVARGDPSTKSCVLSPPFGSALFCALSLPPLAVGVFLVGLVAGVRSFFPCSTIFRFTPQESHVLKALERLTFMHLDLFAHFIPPYLHMPIILSRHSIYVG